MDRIPFLGATLERLGLAGAVPTTGPLGPADARRIVAALNADGARTASAEGGRQPLPGELLALSLLHEAAHLAILETARRQPEAALDVAVPRVRRAVGEREAAELF